MLGARDELKREPRKEFRNSKANTVLGLADQS